MNRMKRHSAYISFAVVAGLALLVACGGDSVSEPEFQVIEDVNFASSLGIDLSQMTKTASGLYYEDVVEGTGDPATAQNTVEISYTGYLANGNSFDSGTYAFVLGSGEVVPGFDEGVTGMKVGGQRRIIIPPELGYGAASVGPIPPGSVLIFDLELLSIS